MVPRIRTGNRHGKSSSIALAHRLRYEEQDQGCVAVDVPPAIDVATITAALDARLLAWRQTD